MAPTALDFSSDFGSAPEPSAPLFSASHTNTNGSANGVSTNGASNGSSAFSPVPLDASAPAVLVIGSQQAAQSGAYQEAVQEAGKDGKRVEMHMVDRLTDAGTTLTPSAYTFINALIPLGDLTPALLSILVSALASNGSLEVAPTDATDAESLRHAKGELTVAGFINGEVVQRGASHILRGTKAVRAGGAASTIATTASLPLRRKLGGSSGGSKKSLWATSPAPVGLIDSDSLLSEADRQIPSATRRADCPPAEDGGPRRKKACKNCTCGLREMEEAEASGDVIRIDDMDMDMPGGRSAPTAGGNERIETTVLEDGTVRTVRKIQVDTKGATSSCGSCFLGDAFRCSSCPFLGECRVANAEMSL